MGAHPYYYFVKYNADLHATLQELREREFEAGRYNPVMPFPPFPVSEDSPAPGAEHESIEDALEAADADGTRSILDLDRVEEDPDFGAVVALSAEELERLFGTAQPSHEMIEQNTDFFENIERGQGIYIVVYKDEMPDELFFAGYSYD